MTKQTITERKLTIFVIIIKLQQVFALYHRWFTDGLNFCVEK